jgi:hypothetical protein
MTNCERRQEDFLRERVRERHSSRPSLPFLCQDQAAARTPSSNISTKSLHCTIWSRTPVILGTRSLFRKCDTPLTCQAFAKLMRPCAVISTSDIERVSQPCYSGTSTILGYRLHHMATCNVCNGLSAPVVTCSLVGKLQAIFLRDA